MFVLKHNTLKNDMSSRYSRFEVAHMLIWDFFYSAQPGSSWMQATAATHNQFIRDFNNAVHWGYEHFIEDMKHGSVRLFDTVRETHLQCR